MYLVTIPNQSARPAILLRESYREDGRVKNRTLANLSNWAPERIAALQAALRGERLARVDDTQIVRSLPPGHVAAVLGTARRIGLDRILPDGPERQRDLVLALIVERLIDPAAKLATSRAFDETTAIDPCMGFPMSSGKFRLALTSSLQERRRRQRSTK